MRPPQFSPDALYSEGLLVGYRWFDAKDIPVMYPFGYGLSYVDFDYSDIKANKKRYNVKDVIKVTFNITNSGNMVADEVVQLYVSRVNTSIDWPVKELKAFQRVTVGAGETEKVTLEVPVENLRYWNVDTKQWELEEGKIELLLGKSSLEILSSLEVEI